MKRYDVRPSVRRRIAPHSSKVCCCAPAGGRYRLIVVRRTRVNAGSATLSAYVVAEHRLVD